jgi:hypothetical protein
MPLLPRICRIVLILHALLNIAQGIYSLVSISSYAALMSEMFGEVPEKALQSIGTCTLTFPPHPHS